MARPDAVATGLYVPTPAHLIADMAMLIQVDEPPAPVPPGSYDDQKTAIAVVDACCGEGSAVELLCAELDARSARVSIRSYACELEETRAREAEGRLKWGQFRGGFECGDAFCLRAEPTPGAGLMLSNPPYHDEKGARGRLEVRFLRRTIGLLAPGGVLLLVVPHYSLADMVDPLAWELDHVRCFRFPDDDFGVYKQVLLVGKKRARLLRPDDLVVRELRRWADDAAACQPWDRIQTWVGAYAAPQTASHAKPFAQWEVAPLDLAALDRATGPWRRTTRSGRPERIATIYPAQSGLALLRRRFPVVTPLRPAYVAAAIACGLFDGEVVRPDDPAGGLPVVLVRGVFARDFVAVDEKVGADGEVVGEVQVQRPRLEVTALDMTTGAYVALQSTAERTDGCSTIGDFLALYGRDLLAVMRRNCPVLHDPARDEAFVLPEPHAFSLFPAQADAVRAMVKLTHPRFAAERAVWLAGGLEVTHADRDPRRRNHIEVDEEDSRVSEVRDRHSGRRAQIGSADRGGSLIAGASGGYRTQTRNHRTVDRPPIPLFIGELGGGKTVQSLIFARASGARSVLVLCPPHLVERNWPTEVVKALGGHVRQTTLDSISAIDALAAAAPVEFQVAILSREAAKLGHARASVTGACPACGGAVPPGDLAAKRARCEAPLSRRPSVDEDGRRDLAAAIVLDLARALLPVAPHKASVVQFVEGRAAERRYAAVVRRLARIGGGEATPEDEAWRTRCREIARRECAEACVRAMGRKLVDPRAAFRLALASGSPALVWESLAEGLGKDRDGGWEATTHLRQAAAMLSLEQATELEAWVESGEHDLAPTAAAQRLAADNVCGYVTRDAGELRFDGKPLGDVEHAVVAIDLLLKAARWEPARLCGEPLWQAVPDPRRVPLADYIAARHPRLFDFFIRDECFPAGTLVDGKPIESIRVGDEITAFDETTGAFAVRRVVRVFRSAPAAMVRVSLAGREIVCTAGHPFWTPRGWVRALDLLGELVLCASNGATTMDGHLRDVRIADGSEEPQRIEALQGAGIRVLPGGMPEARQAQELIDIAYGEGDSSAVARSLCGVRQGRAAGFGAAIEAQEAWAFLLRRSEMLACAAEADSGRCHPQDNRTRQGDHLATYAREESDARSRDAREDEDLSSRAWPENTRGQRPATSGGATPSRNAARLADGDGREDGPEAGWDADSLQDRHRERGVEARDRGGWRLTSIACQESAGREEGGVFAWARVERVEVLEPTSDGTFGGVCPDGHVYNFEVEGLHTYVADGFVVHNCHEHSENSSAQTGASEKLMRLIGRGVDLTGSACSGYAESLFTGTRVRDPRFREAFARGEEREFVRQYGFVKRIASDVDKETGKIVAYGSMSDRVERSYRITGNAPGVLPLFLLDHLLRTSVPLHKADLGLALPPHTEHHVPVDLPDELAATFAELIKKTIAEIKRSRWKKGLAGKLWGALGELVSFPDVCTDDVTPGGVYEVRYPPGTVEGEDEDRGARKRPKKARLEELGPGPLVCGAPTLPASIILPKERAMLEHVEAALRAGERVLVYPRHVELMPRLARLIERELGEPCPVLYASLPEGLREAHGRAQSGVDGISADRGGDVVGGGDAALRVRARSNEAHGRSGGRAGGSRRTSSRGALPSVRVVGAGERQAWIESEVVNKGRRVLVVNPVAVKTGLNVLTWFSQAWWHENPNCDALTGRQANGRIDRIGKTRATRSLYPTAGDLQEKAYRLWMHKIAVSLAVDGLDPGSALALAGLDGDADAMDGVSVGRQLLALLEKKDR